MLMNPLERRKPHVPSRVVHIDDLIPCLNPDIFDQVAGQVRMTRETFPCPYVVRDHDEFHDVLFHYWMHYQRTFFHLDHANVPDVSLARGAAYEFVQQHLKGYSGGLRTAEANAIAGREGGMILVVDSLTEGICTLHTKMYVDAVFNELVPPNDWGLRFRLAAELLHKYGACFEGVPLQPVEVYGANLEEYVMTVVKIMHEMQKKVRQ
jgi:hypothetical protein